MKPKVSVSAAVVSRNTRDLLRRCLEWLGEACGAVDIRTAVIENGSTDGSLEMVKDEFPGVRVLSEGANLGYSRAVNLAFRELPGPYYLVLNGDCRLRAGDVARLVEIFATLEAPGVLGPRQVDESGRECLTRGPFPTPWREWRRRRLQRRFRSGRPPARVLREPAGEPRAVDWVSGSCWLVSEEAVKAAGPLDEGYFLYFEDIDWCRKVREAGLRVYYAGGVTAVHAEGKSAAAEPETAERSYRRSQLRFAEKHWPPLANRVLRAYLAARFRWRSLTGPGEERARARRILQDVRSREGVKEENGAR